MPGDGRRIQRRQFHRGRFGQIRDGELVQQFEYGFVDAAQRLAHGAVFRLIAGAVLGEAVREDHRAVDGANHFESADAAGVARQLVSAIRARDRPQNTGLRQLLQDLRQQRDRQVVGIGDILGAGGRAGNRREVPQGDEAVIRFFGQLEHGMWTFQVRNQYTTPAPALESTV